MIKEEFYECLGKCSGKSSVYVENVGNFVTIGCFSTEKSPLISTFQGNWRSIADFTKQGQGFVLERFRIPRDPDKMEEFTRGVTEKIDKYTALLQKWQENKEK